MPKIRSITYFANLTQTTTPDVIAQAGKFLRYARPALEATGVSVQTTRFASQPFPKFFTPDEAIVHAQSAYALCQEQGINYLAIGGVGLEDDPAYLGAIWEMMTKVQGVFATAVIADKEHGIDIERLLNVAYLIQQLSKITSDGMTNLYFAALANCPPGSPFFPVAYHDGGEPQFALAIQAADLAVAAFTDASTPTIARDRLTQAIQEIANRLVPVAEKLAQEQGIRFGGLDFSLAPYPVAAESLGGALEGLGVRFGGNGLVAGASLLMNAIESADFPRAGFCGLMLPVLEDSVLATRATEGYLSVNDLLLLSAVCGTGLDCIPLPGEVTMHALQDILLDVAALSLRLDKPLTARLMPFPDKQAGDKLSFDFEFFADSTVLRAPRTVPTLLGLGAPTRFNIAARKKPYAD